MGTTVNTGSSSRTNSAFVQLQRIRRSVWAIAAAWTVILVCSFAWYYDNQHVETETLAHTEARSALKRDMLFRRWASSHGGVYVPVSGKSPPNPYLSHVPERDLTTPSGRQLTLVNPAYMTRQVYELARKEDGFGQAHITSQNPLRPENAPDEWEARALKEFEMGTPEVKEFQIVDGKPHMRLMQPIVTEAGCLKCHAGQGYQVGEIRGGISVSIPMQAALDSSHKLIAGVGVAHGVIWILGLGMIGVGSRNLVNSTRVLRESEERYRTVADFTSDWEYWVSPQDTIIYMSPSCQDICGYRPDEFIADPQLLKRIIHPDDRFIYDDHLHHFTAEGAQKLIDFRIIAKDGHIHWISHVCRTIYDPLGRSLGLRASNRDITERKNAEEKLLFQSRKLIEEVDARARAQEELAVKQQQLELLNQSLEVRISETVAELRQKDQLMIQQARLAAMGEMINNIAHQWRQPLNNVGLIVQNLQLSYAAGTLTPEEMEKEVATAMDVIMHMSHTIDDFRNFFRPEKEKQRFSVNRAVKYAVDFVLATLASSHIRVVLDEGDSVSALGYQNEYIQVLLNILGNARDFLEKRNVSEPWVHITVTVDDGRSVVIIRDNGGGIAEDVLPKIFDPYFTTKGPGKGTGIGLYMSKAIIEKSMDGRLSARNVDGGAEFRIDL
jgi:PAS domain S-box-containing protein